MLLSTLILPGVMLYLMYAIVAPHVLNLLTKATTRFTLYAINPPPIIQAILGHSDMDFIIVSEEENEFIKKAITEGEEVFLLIFPANFENLIAAYDVRSGETAPEIVLYYNSLVKGSTLQYSKLLTVLNVWESSVVNKFDINRSTDGDLADSKEKSENFLSILLPMFLMMFMFYSAIAVTTGAITGEKERGTFTLLFVAPVDTRELAAGKVVALSIETLLCGISGSLGILLALPRLIDKVVSEFAVFNIQNVGLIFKLNLYSTLDYAFLLLSLFSVACLIVTMIALVSICAKTVREAQMLLAPLIMLLMSISLFATFYGNNGQTEWYHCFIPFYNTIMILSGIFGKDYTFFKVLLTALSNLFYGIFGTEILSRLFKNEKIIYGG